MIDLFSSRRLPSILDKAKEFLISEVYPFELQWLQTNYFELESTLNEKRQKVKDMGFWLPHFSVEEGGVGLNLVEFAQLSEVLGSSPFGHLLFNCQAPDIGNMELLHQFADEKQKEEFLEPLSKGKIRSCFAMTEPEHAGSNPVVMSTLAKKDGNEYVINGHKWFTTAADGAEFCIVMAVTNPENDNRYAKASMIIVPTKTNGFELVRNIPIMGDEGSGYLSHAEVRFNNCRVPAENIIGSEGDGFKLAQERLGPGRIHHCMRWIGICERALDLMCKRAVERELSPGKPLSDKQTIQNWIAESKAGINAARLMVLHAAHKMQNQGQKAAKEDISTIKFFVSDVLMNVLDKSIQVHGALGITDDTILSFWYRHERGSRIYDGPDEVHKSVLARSILRNYELKIKN
ncbi:MAG: acyl-CoA dehydrogenase family protein [Bacteroidota bacterium]